MVFLRFKNMWIRPKELGQMERNIGYAWWSGPSRSVKTWQTLGLLFRSNKRNKVRLDIHAQTGKLANVVFAQKWEHLREPCEEPQTAIAPLVFVDIPHAHGRNDSAFWTKKGKIFTRISVSKHSKDVKYKYQEILANSSSRNILPKLLLLKQIITWLCSRKTRRSTGQPEYYMDNLKSSGRSPT